MYLYISLDNQCALCFSNALQKYKIVFYVGVSVGLIFPFFYIKGLE